MAQSIVASLCTAVVRMPDGSRVPILIDEQSGLPIAGENVWLIAKRSTHKSPETILGDIGTLSIVRQWGAENGVNLAQRFASELFLSGFEIKSLIDRLRMKVKRVKIGASRVVVDQKWRSRFNKVTVYFKYLAAKYMARSSPYAENKPFDIFMEAWNEWRPRSSSRNRVGLTPEQIDRLLQVTEPGHPRNPWQRRTQERNRLIVLLMLLCGLRLGEVLSLRMEDLRIRGAFPQIDVRRRPPDPEETRRIPPRPKTLGRRLPLHGKVAIALNQYVIGSRAKIPGASRNKNLILTCDGEPCSKEAVQASYKVLRDSDPIFDGVIGHRMRNSFTDLMQEDLKNNSSLNREQKSDILTYAGGWTKTSVQPGRYSQAWLDRQVDEALMRIHDTQNVAGE